MNVLITGANGLLGSRLAEVCMTRGHNVYAGYTKSPPAAGFPVQLDITSAQSIREALKISMPGLIFHCAALTDVDKCEQDPGMAMKVNAEGTGTLAVEVSRVSASSSTPAHFVYVSTDYVFPGTKGMYTEGDETAPVNVYGRSKLLGEQVVLSNSPYALIARPSVIYGSKPASGKTNFALWLLDSLRGGKRVTLLTDQYVSPTLNTSLAKMLLEAAERGLTGVYHMSGASRVSRQCFGIQLAKTFDLDPSLIEASTMAEFQSRWKAKRPMDSSLGVSKASSVLDEKPMDLNRALTELKKEWLNGASGHHD